MSYSLCCHSEKSKIYLSLSLISLNRDHFSIEIKNEKYVIDIGFDDIENLCAFQQNYTQMKNEIAVNKETKQIKRWNDTHFTPTNADAIQY